MRDLDDGIVHPCAVDPGPQPPRERVRRMRERRRRGQALYKLSLDEFRVVDRLIGDGLLKGDEYSADELTSALTVFVNRALRELK
jgi:hypothetical protein